MGAFDSLLTLSVDIHGVTKTQTPTGSYSETETIKATGIAASRRRLKGLEQYTRGQTGVMITWRYYMAPVAGMTEKDIIIDNSTKRYVQVIDQVMGSDSASGGPGDFLWQVDCSEIRDGGS